MAKIELRNITKKFGGFVAVDNLSIDIEEGDFITLLGPSGCGKTTTLRQIAGLETPTTGEILIDGQVVFSSEKGIDVSPAKRNCGFLFQNYALWPHMTVYQNIAFGLENMKWPKDKIDARVKEMLALLKIEEFPDRYPAELSGGQQQRVAIARTLAPSPSILLMDEPLSNLDAKLRLEMRTELKRLHHETGATFVYVTHDQLEAMTLATKICLLKNGLLQQYAPPLTVYNTPNNTFVADFVGNPSINLIECEAKVLGSNKVELKHGSMDVTVTTDAPVPEGAQKFILGIRPEHIAIAETGIPVTVASSLPSGMETNLRLSIGDRELNSVVFGSIDYKIGEKLNIAFTSKSLNLFGENGEFLTTCGVEG
ncbi:MAG: ABC transporter ATP-binding protein [Sphaerochaetaceae bacterium]|nr:ABC transporter ATP-binding protein [Sphaerochaetaceae bacterium]